MQPVFRFAPSPNGFLHLGHAYSVLVNARMAKETGGRFLIRIEDIDRVRCTDALVQACLNDLEWLGLRWEEPVLCQSTQFARYQQAAEALKAQGLLYACTCTRSDIAKATGEGAPRDPDGALIYPGTCRGRGVVSSPAAWRLDMQKALTELGGQALTWREEGPDAVGIAKSREVLAEPARWGDVVLVRKEIPTSYHLAVVLDDALQGITHVVRGQDLYAATALHRLLQRLLCLPEPVYHHHALLLDEEGKKLAKSAASMPIRQLRADGVSANEIRRRLGF